MNKTFAGLLTGIICLVGINAMAFPATYTYSAVGSGSLGQQSFSDVLFTITSTADTSQITGGSGLFDLTAVTASVFVTGIGSADFTAPTENVANNNLNAAGFSDINAGLAVIFAENNPALSAFGLDTSIGPVTGTLAFNSGQPFTTTAGDFIIRSAGDVTYTAVVGTDNVPDASSTLVLMGMGFIALLGGVRKFNQAG